MISQAPKPKSNVDEIPESWVLWFYNIARYYEPERRKDFYKKMKE